MTYQNIPGRMDLDVEKQQKSLPRHIGPNILPNFPLFIRLLCYAAQKKTVAIREVVGDSSYDATHLQMLSDTLYLRNILLGQLSPKIRQQLLQGEEIFINLLAPGSYEFTIGFLAIAAAGAVVVPMSPAVPVEEAMYYAQKTGAIGVLASTSCATLGEKLAIQMKKSVVTEFFNLEIGPHTRKNQLDLSLILISADHELNYHTAGVIIFSSGTTGPPKAAVKPRSFMDKSAQFIVAHYDLKDDDVLLHCLPVHHATGLGINFLPFLWVGATIEFRGTAGGFDAADMWSRWRRGGLTIFSGVPTIYTRMIRYFEGLGEEQKQLNLQAARRFRSMICGSSALPHPLQRKWMEVLGGRRILVRYGSTEMGMVFSTRHQDGDVPDGSVGTRTLGMDVKLSNGDEGEILVRTPQRFNRYLHDPAATATAFDSDGYFQTGDIGRKQGPWYFIMGRASVDIIKSGGYKIGALDVERECLSLPYVDEVIVVGIEDEEFGERVAAAIVLRSEVRSNIRLEELRKDLRVRLAGYKMPTLLRVVQDLPKTTSGKIMKKRLKTDLFVKGHPHVQVWNSTRMGSKL